MEAVGPADDQADLGVEAFDEAVVELQPDGGEDAVAVSSDGAGRLDEWRQAAALGSGAPAVEQLDDLVGVEVAAEEFGPRRQPPVGRDDGGRAVLVAAVDDLEEGVGLGPVEGGDPDGGRCSSTS